MIRHKRFALAALIGAGATTLLACGDRDPRWNAGIGDPRALALARSVAILDTELDRALLLSVSDELELETTSLPIGAALADAAITPDGERLLALSHGVVPRRSADEEGPSLTLIGHNPMPEVIARYELSDPLSGLAIDPLGEHALVYASASDQSFVQNPNELLIVDLKRGPDGDNPHPVSLRSFGGRPERMTFTPTLDLPGGDGRLLMVESDRDVTFVALDDLSAPEVTVQLTSSSAKLRPAGLVYSAGDPTRRDDTRVAVRLDGDANIIIVDLLPTDEEHASETPQGYRAQPNVVFAGGVPSDMAFVQTDGGRRLAALIPSTQKLVLIDADTGLTSDVELGAPFSQMALITDVVGATEEGSDVALLWSTASNEVAFVALGSTVGKPYRSVELLELGDPVVDVMAVPAPNEHLEVLQMKGGSLVVLDLLARTASPITASSLGTKLSLARNGRRAWISAGTLNVAQLDLESLHPLNLTLGHTVDVLYEIGRASGGGALVALHDDGAWGATVLDADNPTLATSREYAGLLLGEMR